MSRQSQHKYFSRLRRQKLARDPGRIYLYRQVQKLHAEGRTHAQIATELYVSPKR